MRENLLSAIAAVGREVTFRDVNLEALPAFDPRRGWPAPTVLVNGEDLFSVARSSEPALGCRVYDGGVPSADVIAHALRDRVGEE